MRRSTKLATPAGILVALLSIAVVQASENASQSQSKGVRGKFNLLAMMHTSTAQFPTLPGVRPWNGRQRSKTNFVYRSIPCRGNAPVNNISSNLPSYNARVGGSRVPSSTRLHPFRFRVERTRRGVEMLGRMTITVCQLRPGPTPNPDPIDDARKPKINVVFRAKFRRENVEHVRFNGKFRLVGGTQRYARLRGSGTLAGYLFCFAPNGCAGTGRRFLDGQVTLQGSYSDSTPRLGG